ncbi:MAG: hypothetical protein MZV65_34740 [Chromatiales bacterium]|nr:hypothetical protein [Chromatiales bacterium]
MANAPGAVLAPASLRSSFSAPGESPQAKRARRSRQAGKAGQDDLAPPGSSN